MVEEARQRRLETSDAQTSGNSQAVLAGVIGAVAGFTSAVAVVPACCTC